MFPLVTWIWVVGHLPDNRWRKADSFKKVIFRLPALPGEAEEATIFERIARRVAIILEADHSCERERERVHPDPAEPVGSNQRLGRSGELARFLQHVLEVDLRRGHRIGAGRNGGSRGWAGGGSYAVFPAGQATKKVHDRFDIECVAGLRAVTPAAEKIEDADDSWSLKGGGFIRARLWPCKTCCCFLRVWDLLRSTATERAQCL